MHRQTKTTKGNTMKEVLTPQEFKKIFDYANKEYFNNELKPIPIKVTSGPGRIASYSWLKDKGKIVKRVMFITKSYKMEKEYFINVVVL